jgi:stress-induced morphogen
MTPSSPPGSSVSQQIIDSIGASLPGARVQVVPRQPGHYEIAVASAEFQGKNRLSCQRLVLKAIAHLMQGERAPLHAVDRLETSIP